ncbi:MAG: NAD(P)H-hydrate dehydratase [Wenzhouxiangellaceae bacterium]|nr:NAD(P)H-hydrate dehydratase [Wenzhouxiangellaceae bacterium]
MAELDRRAIEGHGEDHGVDGYVLMTRAGQALFRGLRARYPEAESVLVCCGGGNNGGDGYVVARLAREAGLDVRVVAMSAPDKIKGEARQAAADWQAAGGSVMAIDDLPADDLPGGRLPEADVIVDALLGTGLDREVRDDYAQLIERINRADAPVIAVDVPSGVNADTGSVMGKAVRAEMTISFIGRKRGLETGQAPNHTGELLFNALEVPDWVYQGLEADAVLLDASLARECLAPREPASHKGSFGHVLVCGGDFNMPGAVMLAARAALTTGSGLVSVATRARHSLALAAGLAEAMWADGEDGDVLAALLQRSDVVALGPGLGTSEWSRSVWQRLLASKRPVVLDADGLNLLAEHGFERNDWILTPHPGEAARLLDVGAGDIQHDRFAAARELAARFDAVVILKGAGSLVAAPDGRVAVCPFGNPAMAAAGMGDALTGIVASLRGQGLAAFDAACAGVVLHARAGDTAAAGRRTLLAGELIAALPRVLP